MQWQSIEDLPSDWEKFFIQAGWFPLVLTRDDRGVYIAASEQADQGNLSNLINLFSKSQQSVLSSGWRMCLLLV